MRKIYQSAPDVPQALANKAIDIIERHFTAAGVRRAEDLSEESKVHMMRELEHFFGADLPPHLRGKDGSGYNLHSQGFLSSIVRWLERMLRPSGGE
jgi:hypothetical protein